MAVRFSLLVVFLALGASGCAVVSESRLANLESTVENLKTQEIRLAILEDTVNSLTAAGPASEQQNPATPGAREMAYGVNSDSSSAARKANKPVAAQTSRPAPAKPAAATQTSKSVTAPQASKSVVAPQAPGPMPDKPSVSPRPAVSPGQGSAGYQQALATLESGRPAAAAPMFREFLRANPGHALAPNAGYWLGECYYSQKEFDTAIIAFKDVVAQFPAHDKAAAAMLKAGYSYGLLGDTANARFYLETLLKDYPSSAPAKLARTRLASL